MSTLFLQGISIQQLETLIEQTVRRCLEGTQLTEHITPPEENNYCTRKETAKLLGISLVTLHKWSVEGLIPSYRIGSRIRYKKDEINNALVQVKSLKYLGNRAGP